MPKTPEFTAWERDFIDDFQWHLEQSNDFQWLDRFRNWFARVVQAKIDADKPLADHVIKECEKRGREHREWLRKHSDEPFPEFIPYDKGYE